ncbi:MAG: FAD-binding oxidoreductase [Myxococcota bacterium]|nr:FAD-binding oxidoreductase [Myxococcota bacterium]
MRDHAEVVVVGAGIMGLSVAYHLAERGLTDVTVLDQGYLCGGGSGRKGRTKPIRERLEKSVALQNDCGLPTRLLTAAEAQRIVPELDPSGIEVASYNPGDGVVFPWPFVWGYAQAARKLGVEIAPWHQVVGIELATLQGRQASQRAHDHRLIPRAGRRGCLTLESRPLYRPIAGLRRRRAVVRGAMRRVANDLGRTP